MRFLVVHKDQAEEARRLVAELATHVGVIVVASGPPIRGLRPLQELEEARGAEVATVSVNRKMVRALEKDFGCNVVEQFATVRGSGAALREWLAPPETADVQIPTPREALETVARDEPRVILAHKSVDAADALAEHRHDFVHRAATALAELAAVGAPRGIDNFFSERGLHFALNGPVAVSFTIRRGHRVVAGPRECEWHLKEGDSTDRDAAARLYFWIWEDGGVRRIIVFYCGPHPESGLTLTVDLS